MILIAFAVAAAFVARPASAHGTLPDGGGFYAGALHPFLAWEHLLLLIALGLLLGRQPRDPSRLPLGGLAVALATGLALGAAGYGSETTTVILALTTIAGIAVALALPLPVAAAAMLATAGGLMIGLGTDMPAPSGGLRNANFLPFAGVFVGVLLIALDTMALASVARRPPFPIAVRVAGSWITAAAVMLLALQIRRFGGSA